jgi:hypothetical protein
MPAVAAAGPAAWRRDQRKPLPMTDIREAPDANVQ